MGDIRAGLEELKLDGALFANVKYYVSGEGDPKIVSLLQEGGAENSNYFSDYVTHLIAGYEALENDISAAKDLYEIPAVTQNWILYSVKCNKLLPTQYFSPEENQLFSNIRVCISQVSRADSKSLWAMITLQGGKCQLRLDRYCTHLITGKASGIKYETAMRHHIHIVTPDWITECCKKGAIISEMEYHPRLLVYPSPNSSTAMITGFMDEDPDNSTAQEDRTKAMLEQLKQRMPWNQPSPPVSSSAVHNLGATNTASVPYSTTGQNTVNIQPQQQQQQHLPRSISSTSLNASAIVPAVSDQNVINQTSSWLPQASQQNNLSQMKAMPSQMQQELSTQQINIQHQLIQHQHLTSQQLTQQQITQHQLQQQSYNQQLLSQQTPSQVPSQQLIGQQQSMIAQQQINSQLPQHQLTSQQQQLLTSQQKQLNQHQIIQQQQMNQQQLAQQPHLAQQQQQVQLAAQQQQQQIVLQQQLSSQSQQISGQHQLAQQPAPPQQLTPEQRQLILLQQQQQQQKIQQISQQLQQSAPQSSQQFVIREGQLQQQSPSQSLIGPNQQGFIVQRDPQWQQQQYMQLQRQQQQQQQIGPQRPGGQWPALRTIREDQQPPQQPRQLIQLDAQTHQQLQQMDPLQRAQFIQKIQKQKNLILQRQMQNRQQAPHIAVIRSPGKPVQPSSLQWVQRPQMMGPQIAQTPGQKPVHPGVQPPALAPINSSNQVIVPAGQNVPQAGQTFQQGQPLTPQQILHMQKQQMARLQFQHLQQQQQQQQQQQGAQQEPPLTPLSGNAQIPPDQQLVVNAKTKTALANMLTNRLQGSTTEGSAAGQLRLMTAQHRAPPPPSQDPQLLAAYQRRTAVNVTNGAPSSGTPIKMQYGPVMQQPKAQFYGHNPNLKLPPDLFLLGCIFVIVEYDVQRPNEVSIWKQVIERHGGEVEPQYCCRATHVLAITQKHPIVVQALREDKRCVSAHWLSDVVSKLQLLPPWHALHFPTPFGLSELPCVKQIVSLSGFEGEERAKVKYMLEALGAKYTNYFSRHNTLLVCRRPDGQKYKKAREWQTSVVNAQWLTDLLCGQMNALHQLEGPKYQQFSLSNPFRLDYSLVPHLMGAWKHPININQESYDKVQQVGQGPNSIRKYKKPRLDGPLLNKDPHLLNVNEQVIISNPDPPPPDKQPRILFSGINPRKHAKRILELGGTLAAGWRDATHLVMSAPLRTVKLLCCLSRCKFIVTLQWLLDCSARNTFLDESPYVLGDPEFEKNFHCNIEKALASPNRGTVLKGKIFYVTPSVIPSPSAIGEIIESAGGMMEKTRKSLAQIQEMNTGKLNYIIVTHENDLHLLSDILRANISVFSAEIVLGAVARQYFQLDSSQV
ncbi:PREDICTED: PAX-interacting protein 1 [Dinoponera quadriceps]|uniref:PAX-interacting protein 1 n=1 Tax=Dinoponera quadriceps TaxID=609295 RepID=A0A6P3X6E5_DINQU|nr:PREDICTED: PAX-interacting protein 1 [Dinoponera quadriceps]